MNDITLQYIQCMWIRSAYSRPNCTLQYSTVSVCLTKFYIQYIVFLHRQYLTWNPWTDPMSSSLSMKQASIWQNKNLLLPESYMFWTCFLFFGVLFTDRLIVYIILITLFMIWEQCLVLMTGKSVLRRKFHFARGVRGFVNSAWNWGFVFNVFRKWSKVSEIGF